jgi:hypothetical protein
MCLSIYPVPAWRGMHEPPLSELRLEELLRPGASAASEHFCARLRRDSFARVSLPPDASALLLRAQAECPAQSPEPRAQSPKPSPAQLSQANGRLCQPRSEAADLVRLTRFQLGSCGRRRSARRGSRSRTRRSWRRRASSRRIRGGTLATAATPAAASCSSSGATTAARPVEGGLTPAAQLGSPAAWQRSAGPASWQRRSSVAPWQPRPPRAELPGSGPLRSSGSKPCRHRPRTPRLEPPPSLTPQASPHRRREAQPHRRATCYLVITPYQVV